MKENKTYLKKKETKSALYFHISTTISEGEGSCNIISPPLRVCCVVTVHFYGTNKDGWEKKMYKFISKKKNNQHIFQFTETISDGEEAYAPLLLVYRGAIVPNMRVKRIDYFVVWQKKNYKFISK